VVGSRFKVEQNVTRSVLDFTNYIADRTQNFTGREWVFQAINAWLVNPDKPRFFLLIGEPGSGKTAIAGRLSQFAQGETAPADPGCFRPGFLDAVHFCWVQDSLWIDPFVFAGSVATQLANRYPAYRKALEAPSEGQPVHLEVRELKQEVRSVSKGGQVIGIIVNVSGPSPEYAYNRAVRLPLEALLRDQPTRQIVILIDSLDEAMLYSGDFNIVSLLTRSKNLPAGVRFILTCRDEDAVPNLLQDYNPEIHDLSKDEGHANSLKDIEQHVLNTLNAHPQLACKLTADLSPADFAETVRGKSDGNFLYVKYLLKMLGNEKGKISKQSLANFPVRLDGVYREFLSRLGGKNKEVLQDRYAAVLGALAVAQEALTERHLADFTGVKRTQVRRTLQSLRQLLEVNDSLPASERGYAIYHRSFSDFLLDENLAQGYWCEREEEHARIARFYLPGFPNNWQGIDAYGLNYLATHLYESGDHEHLQSLISKPWMEARYLGGGYSYQGFLNDVSLARQTELAKKAYDVIALVRLQMARQVVTEQVSPYTDIDLQTLVWLGRDPEAIGYARQRRTPNEHFEGLFAIYGAIEERSGCDLKLYSEILHLANALPTESQRAAALEKLLPRFPSIQDGDDVYKKLLSDTLKATQQISILSRAEPLVALAERVGKSGKSGLLQDIIDSAKTAIRECYFPEQRAEWLSRLAAALTASGDIAQPEEIWEEAEAIITGWGKNHPHILAKATADLVERLYRKGRGDHAQRIALLIEEKIRLRYQDLIGDTYPIDREVIEAQHQLPEAWSWLGAMWIHLDKQERGEEIFDDLDDWLSKLVNDKRWELVAPYLAEDRITEAMLRVGRFRQARQYVVWLGNEAAILVAQAQATAAGGEPNAKHILAEATQAVLDMPRAFDYHKKEWVKAFNRLLQALGQAGQLVRPDWQPFYKEDGEALSIQAYWTARSGGDEQAEKLLTMALSANSIIDRGLWNDALQRVAQALARTGNLMPARAVIEHIDGTAQRLAAVVELGKGFTRVNLNNGADTCFEEACALVPKLEENIDKSGIAELAFQTVIESGRQHLIEHLLSKTSEPERDLLLRTFFRAMLRTRNFEQARALIEQEKDNIYLGDYSAQVLAEALISAKQPAEAERLIESKGSVPRPARYLGERSSIRQNPIRLHDNCYLGISWGKHLSRLAVCFAQLREYTRCNRIVDALRDSIDVCGNGYDRATMLTDLGWALAHIGHGEEAAAVFQQAEDSLEIENSSSGHPGWAYLFEAVASSCSVSRTEALSERIMKAADSSDGILEDCAIACGKAGQFELAQKFIDQIRGSGWRGRAFIELSREAIRQMDLTAAVQLAFAWPGWMEYRHWVEMLTRLAAALADAHRFDDLRSLIPLARDARLRHSLLAWLAVGLARANHVSKAFDAIERTDIEHAMIFLADSSLEFDQVEPGLSLRVLEEATGVAGWVRADWGKIHEILVESGMAPIPKISI
jgi:hypothetical protein